ncbi:ferric reductase-like transmembrane domain-containing protein [Frankia sp. AgB1.9]|uniref:ferric reductase-like transmembrane domain-containing protein n=2 Tax=Frankia TaxID=1854 RepID=UPI0019333494|nr:MULTISPECIES: ferric reductase-like transmembrane domain-containing protein [unclassified Frankia]MBL7494483.1 ferric reductase-like transmembrane domain-containing protein [Frankia sp. AgW1.1]MBL7550977.1 ferric reductase-like transmembrane domain-containing protein [Frankia sp. AgB1.9]MBL7623621.1 ferric reductase-like transmembrane domain-containing protein [Frankia sp. AgB1.8]
MAHTASGTIIRTAAGPAVRPGVTTDATLGHIAGILGYTAFFLMAATVIWGLLLITRLPERHIRRQTLYGAHMTLAILALAASVVHAQVHFFRHDAYYTESRIWLPWGGAKGDVIPGILGLEIVVLVALSIWFQHRAGYRRWHRFHWLSYPGFLLIAVHSVWASREQHFGIIYAAMAAALLVPAALLLLRVLAPAGRQDESDTWFDVVEAFEDGIYRR